MKGLITFIISKKLTKSEHTTEVEKISVSWRIKKKKKRLIFKIDKEFLKLDKKRIIQRKWAKDLT